MFSYNGELNEVQMAEIATDKRLINDGFIGFAIGRADFLEPLVAWRPKKETREAAGAQIARRYREFVDIVEKARSEKAAPSTVVLVSG
jgi:myo-inositol catabolism protein IolC